MLHYLNNLLIVVNLFFPGTEMKGNEKAKGHVPATAADLLRPTGTAHDLTGPSTH